MIPPSDSFRGPNRWKSLGARSGLYVGCANTSQPISAIFCVAWWALWGGRIILMKDYTLVKPTRWLSCRLLSAVNQKTTKCSSVHSKQSQEVQNRRRISLWLSQKTQDMIFPTDGWTLNFFREGDVTCCRPSRKREYHSNTCERDKQSSLNTAASEWVSSFLTAHQHIIGYSVP